MASRFATFSEDEILKIYRWIPIVTTNSTNATTFVLVGKKSLFSY